MPRMSFDRKVPLPEQRLRVAMAKSNRNQPKKHATSARKAAKRRKTRHIRITKLAQQKKSRAKFLATARKYWTGESDEHP
jgi:hypothetical protein